MKIKDRAHALFFDPRTKLILLIMFSIVVMFSEVTGIAYIIRIIMTFVPVLLISIEGKIYVGIRFTLLFVAATLISNYFSAYIQGVFGMILLFICYTITQFAPTMIMVWYCISTTEISEFLASMNHMHMPQGLTISLAVMMRFFPTLSEEYGYIRDAMKMRGITFGGGNILKIIEYRIIPLLFFCVNIGDELSAAAVTRGLGAPVRRSSVCKIGFHIRDILIIVAMSIMTLAYVYFAWIGD